MVNSLWLFENKINIVYNDKEIIYEFAKDANYRKINKITLIPKEEYILLKNTDIIVNYEIIEGLFLLSVYDSESKNISYIENREEIYKVEKSATGLSEIINDMTKDRYKSIKEIIE